MKLLLVNQWQGNVRELENSIERALALCGDSKLLTPMQFPHLAPESNMFDQLEAGTSLKQKLKVVERQIIVEAIEKTNGKITKAAELLDVTRQHLHNKIKEYKIAKL
jgi:DNA-binding NtrC family response regulator